jgi:predicted nucleic acid-binding protein
MIVVSDTSPLTNLAAIGQFGLLQKLYSEIPRTRSGPN